MAIKALLFLFASIAFSAIPAQNAAPYKLDFTSPSQVPGIQLTWNDEFNKDGQPDPANWKYENVPGFQLPMKLIMYDTIRNYKANLSFIN